MVALSRRACVRACCPDARYRNGLQAVADATEACTLTDWKDWDSLNALGAAYAECGDFEKAVKYQKPALGAGSGKDESQLERAEKRLELYQSKKPYRLDF
jgi:hypothetical protein